MTLFAAMLFVLAHGAGAGELNKDYFGRTTPGAWAEYVLTMPDGSKSDMTCQRDADNAGRPAVTVELKVLAGLGKDTKSKNTYVLPKDFSFALEGLNYGRFTEKMTMVYNNTEMAVDPTTLEAIRNGTKDYRGGLTFEASETMDGRVCDRYAYSIQIAGPNPTRETGKLWMNPTLPFGVVRQVGKMVDAAGKTVTEYVMQLTDAGLNQAIAAATVASAAPPTAPKPALPAVVSLAEGFKAGRVGMDLEVVPGSGGRKLRLALVNKTDAKVTVKVPSGEMQFEVDTPIHTLAIAMGKAAEVVLSPGEKGEPLVVEQRGKRGVAEGHCSLSVYEGTPLFSGSVTMGNLGGG